jgi:NADPH:quinone reductase-like Zn-dependent oxidoreductase
MRNAPIELEPDMEQMRALLVHDYGDPDAMLIERMRRPVLQPDEILLRVHAASINPVDWKLCDGLLKDRLPISMPFIPGGDFSGTVEAAGCETAGFTMGMAVFGMTSTPGYRAGAFAEFVSVKAGHIAAKPASLTHEEAAAVPLAALTAWQAVFDRAELRAGQRILIHAGAGGVGGFAVQFAREAGAIVTATTSAANADYVRALGAADIIDYRTERFENIRQDFDAVIDLIGGETQARSYAVLKRGGVLVNAWGAIMQDKADAAGVRGVKVAVEPDAAQLARIAALIDTGKVRVSVAKVFPLVDCAAALDESRTGHVRGKIVLRVEGS